VVDLFARQARQTPDAAALLSAGAALTYRELDARTNRLARYLRSAGVGPETAVGVCFERSPAAIVAILGILKAGGAYVPLDPRLPAERLAFMLQDTAMPLVLTQAQWRDLAPGQGPAVLCLEELDAVLAAESPEPLADDAMPDQLAYVIYTSGSTGQPKGVQITRRNLAASTLARLAYYRDPVACFLLLSPFAFDSSVAGIFWTLCGGGALLLPEPGQEREPAQLVSLIERHQVSHMLCLPSLYALILAQAEPGSLAALRAVISAGEPCPQRLAAEHHAAVPGATLFNEYGPTEGTVWSTVQAADPSATAPHVPIGRPVPGVQAYILGPYGQPAPLMAPGELCVGGAGLARGYLGRPDLTAERFTPDPFHAVAGARLYRTGDLARYAPDGSIEFLGRIDHQVKIRGFRVELGEIEAVMRRHPAVADAAVIAHDAAGMPRLVGYAVPRAGQTLDVDELRAFMRSALADYMLPQLFVALDALPLTPNGKLDRRALPMPDAAQAVRERPFIAPRTGEERQLAAIWAEVLKIDQVGIHDDFFALGGHSLLAIQVISRIRQALETDISVRHLFEAPTVAALAATIGAARADQPGLGRPPLTAVSRDLPIAPSFAQEGLWFVHQLDPASSAYTIAYEVRLEGRLDDAALEQTFNALAQRHEALRTTFAVRDGRLAQVFNPRLAIPLPLIDLQPGDPAERESQARQLIDAETQRPFDLAHGPLFRTTLLRLGPQEHIVLVMVHHIVFDAWSLGVLVQEAAELYQAAVAGDPPAPPPLPIQYADFAHWERAWLRPQVIQGELEYWKNKLAGAPPVLELATDYPRPAVHSYHGTTQVFEVPAAIYHGLKRVSREHGATLFMTVLAAFNTLLYRYSGQDDISVGTPSANRNHVDIERVIGFFINTLVLRTDLGGEPSFSELLRRVKEVVLEAQDHQHLPFNQLVEHLQPRRSPQYTPLFQVMFAFLQNIPTEARLPDLHARFGKVKTGVAFDLTLNMEDTERGLLGEIEYNTDLFAGETISRMIEHLHILLAAIVADPGQSIAALPLLAESERRRLLVEWNATSQPVPAATVHALFEAQVARTPEATALELGERSWSYAELNRRANRLAHELRRRGIGPETLVGVCLERSPELMAAILGVLKAGGAYVPLDPAYPQERLEYLLGDSGAALLLTEAGLAERWSGAPPMLCLDSGWDGGDPQDDRDPGPAAGPADLAYVIYTSGSTGQPKGVLTPHRAVVNHMLAIAREYGLTAADRLLQLASMSFDVAVEECFPGWSQGATVVLHPGGALAGIDAMLGAIAAASISVVNLPTPYWHELVLRQAATRQELPPRLRLVVIGSDTALTERFAQWRELNGDRVRLINAYGPTETTITSTVLTVDGRLDPGRLGSTLPIGRPIANTQTFVLDSRGQPAPIGVAGELHIAGLGLARGYLNRPDLTAERFVPARFAAPGYDRLYRTGDRARVRADGTLEYLGRIDEQVKIRGFRIEPGEIEAALNQHPLIEQSAVIARADAAGERRLIAYVVAGADASLAAPALRAYLGAQLPQYMIPADFVFLTALPLTRHGKIDRRGLPAPDAAAETRATAYAAPRNAVEQIITGVCQQVLGVERLGIHDNFFDLGAHSLLLVRIHGELVAALQSAPAAARPLTIVDLFKYPTISDLARYLTEEQPEQPALDQSQQRGTNRAEALQRQKQLRQKRRGDTTPGKD
jgi:amino acid adenylation domain-containing protein